MILLIIGLWPTPVVIILEHLQSTLPSLTVTHLRLCILPIILRACLLHGSVQATLAVAAPFRRRYFGEDLLSFGVRLVLLSQRFGFS